MRPLHARYPFLESARVAVEATEVDLGDVVADEPAVVERASERVEGAITDGEVGDAHRRPRVELLSYPIARVLVSLVDEHVCTRKYARAEAETAYQRFSAELAEETQLRSVEGDRLALGDLLTEFDLDDAVRTVDDGYRVTVGAYLRIAADEWGDEWRLVNRELDNGVLTLTRSELLVLCRAAVRRRVADGLPLSVPDTVGEHLEEEIADIREVLAEFDLTRDIDTVVPEQFPPCMKHLLDQVRTGEHLAHHSRFAIASFLVSIGMTTDEIVELLQVNPGFGEEQTRYQVNHIRGATGPTEYSPPSCATMQSYGDCVNMDDRCETISHPLAYYEQALDDADESDLVDWRERPEA